MTLAIGFFDAFAYAVPGSCYLGLLLFLASRSFEFDLAAEYDTFGSASLIAAAVASYLLGHLGFALARALEHLLRFVPLEQRAKEEFLKVYPGADARPFFQLPYAILRAGIEVHAPEANVTAERLLAGALMIRSLLPFLVGVALTGLVEAGVNSDRWIWLGLATSALGLAWVAVKRSQEMFTWAHARCLETAYWLPQIDGGADL